MVCTCKMYSISTEDTLLCIVTKYSSLPSNKRPQDGVANGVHWVGLFSGVVDERIY